jgi:outer membrane lipoprotein-sorting protein
LPARRPERKETERRLAQPRNRMKTSFKVRRAVGVVGMALLAGMCATPAVAGPAETAFFEAWGKINSYTSTVVDHETNGKETQDRTYHFAYLKPHFARIDIVEGPGKGGGAVWTGGDTVRGHQGGFLSGVQLTVSIHDSRAVSLRGDTLLRASFQSVVDDLKAASNVTESSGTEGGQAVDVLSAPLASADSAGVTKHVVYLSKATHLPVQRTTYAGDQVVKTEKWSDVNTNANLKESDF